MQELGPASHARETSKKRNNEVKSGDQTSLLSDNGESSSTSTPPLPQIEDIRIRYPPIPLSRILHPISDANMNWKTPMLPKQEFKASSIISSGFVIEENEGQKYDESILESQRLLKFMDAGKKEVVHRRLATGSTSPRAIGGMLEMLNSFNSFPVKTSLRNSELFNFCKSIFHLSSYGMRGLTPKS